MEIKAFTDKMVLIHFYEEKHNHPFRKKSVELSVSNLLVSFVNHCTFTTTKIFVSLF